MMMVPGGTNHLAASPTPEGPMIRNKRKTQLLNMVIQVDWAGHRHLGV
jgi:hypothetical protein